jgi:dihydropteroate synthase
MRWRCRDRVFELGDRALVMGVVNVTPDSFSDGGRHLAPEAAVARAHELIAEGADLVDFGAESTRPGAAAVPAEEQWRRLGPVLEALADEPGTWSVDTANAEVAERALAAGVHVVNDVSGLGDPEMAAVVARSGAGLVLMHMRGTPSTMQQSPHYDDVASEVAEWLAGRVRVARAAGIAEECVAVDPGIGFGKTIDHNLELIARLGEIVALDRPIVVGVSRKSFLGRLLHTPVDERLEAGLSAAAIAVFLGASIVRTHDVRPTVRAVRIAAVLRAARPTKLNSDA